MDIVETAAEKQSAETFTCTKDALPERDGSPDTIRIGSATPCTLSAGNGHRTRVSRRFGKDGTRGAADAAPPPTSRPQPDAPCPRLAYHGGHGSAEIAPTSFGASENSTGLGADVEAAMDATIPTKGRDWRLALQMYVVRLRAIHRLAGGDPRDLVRLARAWSDRAGLLFTAKECDVDRCFINEWRRAKYPHARGPLEVYLPQARAMQAPAVLSAGKRDATLRLLANLSALLQQRAGAGTTWFLSQRNAGELLGVSHQAAGNLFARLIDLGLLVRKTVGSHWKGKASEYVWLGPPAPGGK